MPQDLPAAFWWKIALNIRDYKNEYTEQNGDLNDIVEKKVHAAAQAAADIQSQAGEKSPDKLL